MATKKQTSECNVRPAIAGNVRQSPDRTYLYLVKEEETNEKEENVLLLCQVSPLRELNVNELAEEKGDHCQVVAFGQQQQQQNFFSFSSISPSF
jgi:hypothetical protein